MVYDPGELTSYDLVPDDYWTGSFPLNQYGGSFGDSKFKRIPMKENFQISILSSINIAVWCLFNP